MSMKINARKRNADKPDIEDCARHADWIEVGVLDAKSVPITLEKRKFDKEVNEIAVVGDQLTVKTGIDLLNKLIDRRTRNNSGKVENA